LCLNPIPTLQDFGLFAGIGTLAAFLAATFFGYPFLRRLPRLPRQEFGLRVKEWLAKVFLHQRRLVVGVSMLVFLSGAFLFRMEVQTDYYQYYLRSAPMTAAVDFVNTHIGGQYPIVVELDTGKADGVLDHRTLAFLDRLSRHCYTYRGVDKVISYLDLLNDGYRAFGEPAEKPRAGSDAGPPAWFADRDQAGQIAMVVHDAGPDLTRYYVDGMAQKTLLFVRTSHINSASFLAIDEGLRAFLAANTPEGIVARVGGTYLRCVQSANRMALSQVYGTFAVFVVLFTVAFAAIPCPKLIFMAFVANLLPILGVYGLLGLLGETLNMGTTTIAAIAVGIGMDDTMHFLARYVTGLEKTRDPIASARHVIHTSGVSMILTSGMISLAFLSLGLSIIKPIAQLGLFHQRDDGSLPAR
jgi:uncharacterized protein